jgi:hypothetical protein
VAASGDGVGRWTEEDRAGGSVRGGVGEGWWVPSGRRRARRGQRSEQRQGREVGGVGARLGTRTASMDYLTAASLPEEVPGAAGFTSLPNRAASSFPLRLRAALGAHSDLNS